MKNNLYRFLNKAENVSLWATYGSACIFLSCTVAAVFSPLSFAIFVPTIAALTVVTATSALSTYVFGRIVDSEDKKISARHSEVLLALKKNHDGALDRLLKRNLKDSDFNKAAIDTGCEPQGHSVDKPLVQHSDPKPSQGRRK